MAVDNNIMQDKFFVVYLTIHLYEDDFIKIDSTGRASMLFDAIPAQLNKNTCRYHVSTALKRDVRADDLLQLIAEMKDSKTVLVSYHADNPNVGMSATIDLAKFKMFVCDTGLMLDIKSTFPGVCMMKSL